MNVNKKESKREAGKPLLAEAGESGDAASLGPGPHKSKVGSEGTCRGMWPGGGGRQRAGLPGKAAPARMPGAKASRVTEDGTRPTREKQGGRGRGQ